MWCLVKSERAPTTIKSINFFFTLKSNNFFYDKFFFLVKFPWRHFSCVKNNYDHIWLFFSPISDSHDSLFTPPSWNSNLAVFELRSVEQVPVACFGISLYDEAYHKNCYLIRFFRKYFDGSFSHPFSNDSSEHKLLTSW